MTPLLVATVNLAARRRRKSIRRSPRIRRLPKIVKIAAVITKRNLGQGKADVLMNLPLVPENLRVGRKIVGAEKISRGLTMKKNSGNVTEHRKTTEVIREMRG